MEINIAQIRERSISRGWTDFVVFEVPSGQYSDIELYDLLLELTGKAQASGIRVDRSALTYSDSEVKYYGDRSLVNYLSRMGIPQWTNQMTV